jgi:hypothetical protein
MNRIIPAGARNTAARTEPPEEAVQHWIKQGGPARLRNIRAAMADLWRKGIITLTRTESGDFRANLTELGKSAAKAEEQRDAPVCERCRKSSGDIKKYMVINTQTGSNIIEWMHEDCFVALPLVQ